MQIMKRETMPLISISLLFSILLNHRTTQSQYLGKLKEQCPAGNQCLNGSTRKCIPGMYSLKGWPGCCDIAASVECGKRPPGHFAFNSSCQCAPISCENRTPMRGGESTIICGTPPIVCQPLHNKPCASPSMIREPHTCNCLKVAYPCRSNEVLWGNMGGPYTCLTIMEGVKNNDE